MANEVDDPTEEVLDPETQDGAEGKDKPKEPTAKELQRQLDRLTAELDSERKVNQFWQEREKNQPRAAAPAAKAKDEEDDDPLESLDILKLITEAENPKAAAKQLKSALRDSIKREGYVSKAELEQTLSALIGDATALGQLSQEFPFLTDPKSAGFKETQKELEALSRNPSYKGLPHSEQQRIAAERAERTLIKSGKLKTRKDDDEEDERIERIRDQEGRFSNQDGRRRSDEPSAEQKKVAKRYGVSEADLKKYGKQNVGPGLAAMLATRGDR